MFHTSGGWEGHENDGDIILLDNMEEGLTLMAEHADVVAKVRLMTKEHVRSMTADQWDDVAEVSPWGWNAALVWQLERMGVPSRLLPDKGRLAAIRKLSNRESSIDILREMVAAIPKTVGWRGVAHSVGEVKTLLIEQNGGVVKAPWSSSGRGKHNRGAGIQKSGGFRHGVCGRRKGKG